MILLLKTLIIHKKKNSQTATSPRHKEPRIIEEKLSELQRRNTKGTNVNYFKECQPLLSDCKRLIGLDGQAKMSKSLNNGIYLGDDEKALYAAVMKMYTDPHHIKVSDPGRIEGNVVFSYLDTFDCNKEEVEGFKKHYQQGGLGDVVLKKRLFVILNELLAPIRERYHFYYNDKNLELII